MKSFVLMGYSVTNGKHHLIKTMEDYPEVNTNGTLWHDRQTTWTEGVHKTDIVTGYTLNPLSDLATHQQVTYTNHGITIDNIYLSYIQFDNQQLSRMGGIRTTDNDISDYVCSLIYYNSNGQTSGTYRNGNGNTTQSKALTTNVSPKPKGMFDYKGPLITVMDSTADGTVMQRTTVAANISINFVHPQSQAFLMHSLNSKELLASYQTGNEDHPHRPQFNILPLYSAPITEKNPLSNSMIYVIKTGDTWATIAQQYYQDASRAARVATDNQLDPESDPPVGYRLFLTPIFASKNHSGNGVALDVFMNNLMGSLYPHLHTPKPHHSAWKMLVEIVVAVVIAIAIPEFEVLVLNIGSLGVAGLGYEAWAVAGALMSVINQGVSMALHDQKKFSWKAVLESTLQEAVTHGLGQLKGFKIETASGNVEKAMKATVAANYSRPDFFKAMMFYAQANMVLQVGEMALGVEKKFNWNHVISAGISGAIGDWSSKTLPQSPVFSAEINTLTGTFLGGAIEHRPITAESFALQVIGTAIGTEIGMESIAPLKRYEEAQLAARMQRKKQIEDSNRALKDEVDRSKDNNNNNKNNAQNNNRYRFFGGTKETPDDVNLRTQREQTASKAISKVRKNETGSSGNENLENPTSEQKGIPYSQGKLLAAKGLPLPKIIPGSNPVEQARFVEEYYAERTGMYTIYGLAGAFGIVEGGVVAVTGAVGRFLTRTAVSTFGRFLGQGVGSEISASDEIAKVPENLTAKNNFVDFDVHPRVLEQLNDPRLGELAGKLDIQSLNKFANNPEAQFLYDAGTGHINVVQNIEGKLLRITVPRDTFKIISVGPVKERNLINSIANGRFIAIGNQLEESSRINTYMMRVQP